MNEAIIRDNILNKVYETNVPYPNIRKYSENHVFDDKKSVKWNKEEVIRQNEEIQNQVKEYNSSVNAKFKQFQHDIEQMLIVDYDFDEKTAEKISSKAYAEGHSGGFYEILNKAVDYGEFIDEIVGILKR